MGTSTFGFGQDDAGLGGRAKKFQGEKGKTYRLGLVYWGGMEKEGFSAADLVVPEGAPEESLSPKFIRAQRNYIQGVGYVINKGPEYTALAGEPPKMMVATIIVSWPLDKKNQPSRESLFNDLPDVQPWIFGGEKYEKLKNMHISGYPMHDYDIQATCEDSQFQKFAFLPAKQCLFKEMLKSNNSQAREIANHVIAQVRALAPVLERELGQDLTLDALREKLGQTVASPAGRSVTADPDVDNLLSGMLDS